jgi:hypothetical protein
MQLYALLSFKFVHSLHLWCTISFQNFSYAAVSGGCIIITMTAQCTILNQNSCEISSSEGLQNKLWVHVERGLLEIIKNWSFS